MKFRLAALSIRLDADKDEDGIAARQGAGEADGKQQRGRPADSRGAGFMIFFVPASQ
jgi:hypothetical protein